MNKEEREKEKADRIEATLKMYADIQGTKPRTLNSLSDLANAYATKEPTNRLTAEGKPTPPANGLSQEEKI